MNGYSGKPKKGKTEWFMSIFFGLSVLVFVGVVIIGILISRDEGISFRSLISGDSETSLKIQRR